MNTQPMNQLALRLALLALLALVSATALAGDLPVQAERIWAPTGDLIGHDNHITATFNVLDAYGDPAKIGEDTQLLEEKFGSGLFNWQKTWESGYLMGVRGAGSTQTGERINGHLDVWGSRPGRMTYKLNYRAYDQFSDRTNEMRSATFGFPPAPEALTATPILEWSRTDAQLRYRLSSKFAMQGGVRYLIRDGAKASLLGAGPGAVPNLKGFDSTTSREIWLGVDYLAGNLAADLVGSFRTQDGDRNVGTDHAYADDRTSWRTRLGVNWDATTNTRVLGFGSVAKLENKGTEAYGGSVVTPEGETKASGGQLGLIQHLGPHTNLRLAANFQKTTTTATVAQGSDPLQTVDRDRTRQDYRVHLTHTGLARTRLELGYRLQTSKREQILVDGNTFTTDQDKTRNAVVFKARHRYSRALLMKLKAGWSRLERKQSHDWDDPALKYWLGDYNRNQLDWKLGLQTRPFSQVRLDLGHQLIDRKFENQITDGIETTFKANRGYANLNWNPRAWLTVFGMVSVGLEKYEMGETVAPSAGMGTVNYDGTTWRFAPGIVAQVRDGLQAELMYEGVRFEDQADADGTLAVLESDHDRFLARLSWQARENISVSATYRRTEFAEQRWDNYIHDLYGLSFTGQF